MSLALTLVTVAALANAAHVPPQIVGINVLLNQPASQTVLDDLDEYGTVLDVLPGINAVTMRARADDLPGIRALPWVLGANLDALRSVVDAGTVAAASAPAGGSDSQSGASLPVADLAGGANLWNLDAMNVTDFGGSRTVDYDGEGVYVAVIDTGLPSNWREYFPEQRIDVLHARAFGGGGGENGTVSEQPNRWEHDTSSHGLAVTGSILGFRYAGPEQLPEYFNGVAPKATIIPVRVFNGGNNDVNAWTSVLMRGLDYVTNLKLSGALGDAPLVACFGWGGPTPDFFEQAAIDYAIAHGVIVVAAAADYGDGGMGYPAAYAPVISCAASGWVRAFPADDPTAIEWIERDVPENDPLEHYISPFSSRELPGQDLDVTAPSFYSPVPFTMNGQVDYFFAGHSPSASLVAGVAALMLQKNPGLAQAQIDQLLVDTCMPLQADCREVTLASAGPGNEPTWGDHDNVFFSQETVCWGANATGAGLIQADAALAATPWP